MGKIFFYFNCVFCLFLLSACKNPFLETRFILEINLPQWPPVFGERSIYPKLSRWRVEITVSSESDSNKYVNHEIFYVDSETENFAIDFSYGQIISIIAQPVTLDKFGNENLFFYPCGMIYPYCNDKLEWESGFTADILKSLLLGSENDSKINNFISKFNWNKLDEYLKAKIHNSMVYENTKFYNPWNKKKDTILELISSRKFNATSLNINNTETVKIEDYGLNYKSVISPFVIENEIIEKYKSFCLSNDEINFYSIYNEKCVIIYNSKKLVRFSNLPLFIE